MIIRMSASRSVLHRTHRNFRNHISMTLPGYVSLGIPCLASFDSDMRAHEARCSVIMSGHDRSNCIRACLV